MFTLSDYTKCLLCIQLLLHIISVNISELSLCWIIYFPCQLIQLNYESTNNISNLGHGLDDIMDDISDKMNTCINSTVSPKKDTAVQTGICLKL